MMEDLYLAIGPVDDQTLHCSISSAIVIFVVKYSQSREFQLKFLQSDSVTADIIVPKSSLSDIDHVFLESRQTSNSVTHIDSLQCSLPATVSKGRGNFMVRSGLSSVLRHVVKTVHLAYPSRKIINMLGHKGICLKACAEVSVWTKFCEVELPKVVDLTLSTCRQHCSGKSDITDAHLPIEVLKLENHLRSPAIIRNKAKRKREGLRRLAQEEQVEKFTDITSEMKNISISCRRDENGSKGNEDDAIPGMQHIYAEGTDLTLTDLIIFPCISLLLNCWKESLPLLTSHIPKVLDWYQRMLTHTDIKDTALNCNLPLVEDWKEVQLTQCTEKTIVLPNIKENILNIRDPSKKKTKAQSKNISQVVDKLKEGVTACWSNHPCGDNIRLSWEQLPASLNPSEGDLPAKRVERKCQQLENLIQAVRLIAKPGNVIVDFCAGGGHLGIVLAYYLPACKVILVENKEESITRAQGRIDQLQLTNVQLYQCNLDYFHGHFDIGVCLHACGVATDLVLQSCLDNNASFVICPCCYGSIQATHTMSYPRSQLYKSRNITYQDYLVLGHAADQTEFSIPQAQTGKNCMLLVDTDRAALAQECGYEVTLCSLIPLSCSPKNNLLIGTKISKSSE